MEITQENLATIEIPAELKAAIFDKFEGELPAYLQAKNFYVKPTTEYETELRTANETAVRKAIGDETAKLYGGMDQAVGIALGKSKPHGMKSIDWYRQLETEELLPLSEEAQTRLKAAMKGTPSATKDAVVEQLRRDLEKAQNDQTAKEQAAFTRTVNRVVTTDLRTAPVRIDETIKDEAAKATARTAAIGTLRAMFDALYEGKEDQDGELYFVKKGTDKALMNAGENRPMTPTEIIRADFSYYLMPVGHQAKGAGSGNSGGNTGSGGGFKSIAEITAYAIKEKGLAAYTPAFDKFVEEEAKKAGLKY